jgi:hypothetical protein
MKTMNMKHTAKNSALKTAPLTSVVLGIPHFSQVFPNKNRTLPKVLQHGFNPISPIYVVVKKGNRIETSCCFSL